jgi:hypothetical protein
MIDRKEKQKQKQTLPLAGVDKKKISAGFQMFRQIELKTQSD